MSEATIHSTWGYRPDGSARIFDLGPGETLPDGWHPSPTVITDQTRATAEALSATAARAAETPRRPPVASPSAPDMGAEDADIWRPSLAQEQVQALLAENTRLATEVAELRKALADSEAARTEAVEWIASLTTQLEESRVAPPAERVQADGDAPDADPPAADAPPPARTRDEAREEVRALLGEDLTNREIARRVGVSPSTVAAVRKTETERAST